MLILRWTLLASAFVLRTTLSQGFEGPDLHNVQHHLGHDTSESQGQKQDVSKPALKPVAIIGESNVHYNLKNVISFEICV